MKKIITISKLALIVLTLSITACKKSTPDAAVTGSGTVTATVDGGAFTANFLVNILYTGNVLTIQGADATGKQIQIQLGSITTTGTYSLGLGTNHGSATYGPGIAAPGVVYSSVGCGVSFPQAGFVPNGTLVITELSATKIAGTFSFNAAKLEDCSSVKNITGGVFSKNL
ncbi:MAG: DUF6252 family protein [Ferruginibacter sp.]|nr:hypothetical protein [Ferruginibacter sp.]